MDKIRRNLKNTMVQKIYALVLIAVCIWCISGQKEDTAAPIFLVIGIVIFLANKNLMYKGGC